MGANPGSVEVFAGEASIPRWGLYEPYNTKTSKKSDSYLSDTNGVLDSYLGVINR
ncbi:MAG: hypothetical protein ACI91T_000873 [Natronomonas sp.]|jgi:hypothetical protein